MTITEVAQKYDMSADTLRYYERIGLIPPVGRLASGVRDFSDKDCGWVEFIRCMRGAGVQVEALIEYVALFQKGDKTQEARKQILVEQHKLLEEKAAEINNTLARLTKKIANYDMLIKCEEKLRKED